MCLYTDFSHFIFPPCDRDIHSSGTKRCNLKLRCLTQGHTARRQGCREAGASLSLKHGAPSSHRNDSPGIQDGFLKMILCWACGNATSLFNKQEGFWAKSSVCGVVCEGPGNLQAGAPRTKGHWHQNEPRTLEG